MQYFDIIFFAIVAGILGIRLYRILGRKTDLSIHKNTSDIEEKINTKPEGENNYMAPDFSGSLNGEGVAFLKEIDKSFNEKKFLSGAESAFKLIIEAFNSDDKKTLRKFLDDEVYRAFETAIIDRESKGHYVENPIKISVEKSKIESIKVLKGLASIRVNIISTQLIVIKDSETEKIIDTQDASEENIDIWEFSREVNSEDPNWKLTHTESG